MNVFRVWVHPQKDECRVRVEGAGNAKWLLQRLSQFFVFRSFEPMIEDRESTLCTFQIPCNPPLTPQAFQKLLAGIPEVQLSRG